MTPDKPKEDDPRHSDDDNIPDLWSGTEMTEMLSTVAHLTQLCVTATNSILSGDPDRLAGSLGTIMGRARALREHVWEYTKSAPSEARRLPGDGR